MAEVAISVQNVSKDFRLVSHRSNTLKSAFTGLLQYRHRAKDANIQHALQDISFEIKKGEFFGIVGRNGSGKSTLLKMLAGIYQPNEGKINVKGSLVPFIELGVGFNPELTGRENVYLNGALLGFGKKQIDDQFDSIVEFAELEQFMDQKLKNYSSGMQVRLAFSMAIRAKADILLIDEVLAVGDADFQRKCFEYFKELKKNKKTVVLVSHDMNAIREYCDRVVLIEASHLAAEGSADKIASMYARMFTKDDRHKKDQYTKRWGDNKVEFKSIKVEPSKITNDTGTLTISTDAKVHEDVENPIFGFMIKNTANQSILGTNTQIKHIKVGELKKGSEIKIKWEVPNVFSDGVYYVDPAVVHENTIEVYDWWEEATNFKVFNEETTPYITTPNIKVTMSKKKTDKSNKTGSQSKA